MSLENKNLEQKDELTGMQTVENTLYNGLKPDDFNNSGDNLKDKLVPASTEKNILGTNALVGEAARNFMEGNKKLRPIVTPNKLEKIFGARENIPTVVWNNIVFYLPAKDLEATTLQESQDFALQALNDMSRTDVGKFILTKLKEKYASSDKKFLKVMMRAGPITGGKENYIDGEDEDQLTSGNLQNVHKDTITKAPKNGGAGSGINSGGVIGWPFQHARYHMGGGLNKNGNIVATSPSEVLFHEFCHEFNSYDLVKDFLQTHPHYDINGDGIADIQQGKSPMKEAGHTGSQGLGIFGHSESATYFEQIFAYEKKLKGYTDHNPRPHYKRNKIESPFGGVERIPIRVDNAAMVRPTNED